jgi:hypothetical protein
MRRIYLTYVFLRAILINVSLSAILNTILKLQSSMKKLLVSLFSAISIVASLSASPTVIAKSMLVSKYLAFGSGSVLFDKPAVQTNLFVGFENGWSVDLWNSKSFTKWNKDFGSEVDYGIAWDGKIGDQLTANVGVIYFDEPKVFTLGAGDIVYSHASLTRVYGERKNEIRVTLGFENYVTMPHSGFQGGNLYSLGASRTYSLGEKVSLTNSLTSVYDDGGFGFDSGWLLRGILSLDWKISERMTLALPQVSYYIPLTVHDSRKTDAVFSGGLAYRF